MTPFRVFVCKIGTASCGDIFFGCYYEESLQQNQRTQRFIVATHRPPRFFWLKKTIYPNLPVTVVNLLVTKMQQTNLPKKTTNNSPPQKNKQPTGKPSNLQPIISKPSKQTFPEDSTSQLSIWVISHGQDGVISHTTTRWGHVFSINLHGSNVLRAPRRRRKTAGIFV